MLKPRRAFPLPATLGLILVLCLNLGCATGNFQQPVASFQKSIERSSGTIASYYSSLNAFERDLYLQERLYDPELKVEMIDANGRPTPLAGAVFSAEGINARLKMLDLLSLYASRLAALAGSQAPAKVETATQALGDNLGKLSDTMAELAQKGDPTAGQYIKPVATLSGLLARMYMESLQEAELVKSVNQGAPVVDNILNLLEKDMVHIVSPQQRTGFLQKLADCVAYYNQNRRSFSFEQRAAALEKINAQAQSYETAITADPASLIQGMRQAHDALVAYANSDRTPQDLAGLASAMEVFAIRVEVIAQAVKQFPHN